VEAQKMIKKISILGSTGSIGIQTLSVIEKNKQRFKVYSLSAGRNIDLLLSQISKFRPKTVSLSKESDAALLKSNPLLRNTRILSGDKGLAAIGKEKESDILVSATSGVNSLTPTVEFLKMGKRVCIASKEIFLLFGDRITKIAEKYNGEILPIDSEHSGLFQLIQSEPTQNIRRVFLTASGGPFYGKSIKELMNVTPKQALKHPTWSMGEKISIDSATMMNKAIEIIEASIIFKIPHEKIFPILNKKSHIHAIVEYIDGNIAFSGSQNNMEIPIAYSLNFPARLNMPEYNLSQIKNIELAKIDEKKHKAFSLARRALNLGGSMPAVMNAANSIAVENFLKKKIKFTEILNVVDKVMLRHKVIKKFNLKKIIEINEIASKEAYNVISEL
jgi:1-deoxy-D-xylulose-5-phosphate reductoisomerase